MTALQDLYIRIFGVTFKLTGNIPKSVRSAVVNLSLLYISATTYLFSVFGARGAQLFIAKPIMYSGTVALILLVLFSVDGPLERVRWKKNIVYPYFFCAIWMCLMSLDHLVGQFYGIYAWTILLLFPAFWFITSNNKSNAAVINKLCVINGAIGGIYLIGCYMFAPIGIHAFRGGQYAGLASHPNMFGIIMVMILACYLYLAHRRSWTKYIYLVLTGMTLHLLWMSASRASILTAIVMLVIAIAFIPRWKKAELRAQLIAFVVALAIVCGAAFASSVVFDNNWMKVEDKGFFYHYWGEDVYSPYNIEVDDTDTEAVEAILGITEANGSNASERFSVKGKSLDEYSSFRITLWKWYISYVHFRGRDSSVVNVGLSPTMVLHNAHNNILELSYRFGYPAGLSFLLFLIFLTIEMFKAAFKGKYSDLIAVPALLSIIYIIIGMLDILTLPYELGPVALFYLTIAGVVDGSVLGETAEDVNLDNQRSYQRVKRVFDLMASIIMLIIMSPIMLVISIAVKADSKGSVLFVHDRIGQHGKKIKVYKFRSMVAGAEDIEKVLNDEQAAEFYKEYKLDNDPRVTRIGAFLRRTSLDELPQLINVIQGKMSLVGPRPLVEGEYSDNYSTENAAKLQTVKPGITGYWQAYARNTACYEDGRRQQMELFYVDNASSFIDIRILIRTVWTVLSGKGAK